MLSLISGKQRAGKSYTCVQMLIDYLKTSDRPIFTNLPIYPVRMARMAAKNHCELDSVLRRINVFVDLSTRQAIRHYREKNSYFWINYRKTNVFSDDKISHFWDFLKHNSIVILDEIYEYFDSNAYLDKSKVSQRKALLSFTRQHGHQKHDLFLISHAIQDVDSFIRRGIMYQYVIRNSLYTNMFEWHVLRGLKWPWQFFIVEGYEAGEKRCSDRYNLFPKQEVFACYDSFSHSRQVGFHEDNKEAKSADMGGNKDRLRVFLKQFRVWIYVFFGLLIGGGFGVYQVGKIFLHFSNTKNLKGSNVRKVERKIEEKKVEEKKVEVENVKSDKVDVGNNITNNNGHNEKLKGKGDDKKEEPPRIVMITPKKIIWSDGFEVVEGGMIDKFEVVDVQKTITIISYNGKSYKVANGGLRK